MGVVWEDKSLAAGGHAIYFMDDHLSTKGSAVSASLQHSLQGFPRCSQELRTFYLCSFLAPAHLPCQCCLPNPQPSSCGFQVSRDLTPTAVADSRKATAVQQEYRATTASPPPPSPPSENVCVCGRCIRHREVGETGSLLSSGRRDSVLASSSTHARRLHSLCPRSLWNSSHASLPSLH